MEPVHMLKSLSSAPLFVLAVLATPSAFAQTPASAELQAPFSRPQQLVDIGGRRLNLYCSGNGPVTVVFDAPSGDGGASWYAVQPAVAKRTRACVFDRGGMGFSDPAPHAGSSVNAVEDLHQLLTKAGIAAPYLLVGNSLGGGNVQMYAYRYPNEVKGLVLVEPQHEDETERSDKASQGNLKRMYAAIIGNQRACAAEAEKGFVPGTEMWANCIGPVPQGMGRALAASSIAMRRSPAYWRAAISEIDHFGTSEDQLRAARRSFGDLPLMVLSRGVSPYAVPGKPQSALNKAMEDENLALHKEIAALSTRGSHRVVPGAGHLIQADKPEAVVQAVEEVLSTLNP